MGSGSADGSGRGSGLGIGIGRTSAEVGCSLPYSGILNSEVFA